MHQFLSLLFLAVATALEISVDPQSTIDIFEANPGGGGKLNGTVLFLQNFLRDLEPDTLMNIVPIEGLNDEVTTNKSRCAERRRARRLQLEGIKDFGEGLERSRGLDVGQEEDMEDCDEDEETLSGAVANIRNESAQSNEVPSVSEDETTELLKPTTKLIDETTEPIANANDEITEVPNKSTEKSTETIFITRTLQPLNESQQEKHVNEIIEGIFEPLNESQLEKHVNEITEQIFKVNVTTIQPEKPVNEIIEEIFELNVTTIQPLIESPQEKHVNEIIEEIFAPLTESLEMETTDEVVEITTIQSVTETQQEISASSDIKETTIKTVEVESQPKNSTSPDINEFPESNISTSTSEPTDQINEIPELSTAIATEAVPSELTTLKNPETSTVEIAPPTEVIISTSEPLGDKSSEKIVTWEDEISVIDDIFKTEPTSMVETSDETTKTKTAVETTTEKILSLNETPKTTKLLDETSMVTTMSIAETTVPISEVATQSTRKESPEVTESSEVTVSSEVTKSPEITKSPKVTKSPEVTKSRTSSPKVTESVTQSPGVTESITKAPGVTESQTKSPPVTESLTKSPRVTESQTKSPRVTESKSQTPEATESISQSERIGSEWETQLAGALVVLGAVVVAVIIVVKVARKNRAVSGSYKPQKREMAMEEFRVEMDLYRDNYPKGERLI